MVNCQTIFLQEGVPVEIKDKPQWCATLSAAAEGSLFLFAALKLASPGIIHNLETAKMKALVHPSSVSLCSRDSATSERTATGDVPRQGESTSSFRVGESSLGPDKPEKSDEVVPKIHEEVSGMEEQKWYSSLPLPEAESLEPSLHAFVEAEDVESLDGVRLSLLAAAREQETALSKELAS